MAYWRPPFSALLVETKRTNLPFNDEQETILGVASVACTSHIEERSSCWKRPWICISENGRDDEPAIWVWVNGILLDSSNEGLVLDCCVMPVGRMGEATSTQLGAAIELDKLNGDGAGTVYPKVVVLDVNGSRLLCS